jgi:hypothetical protein
MAPGTRVCVAVSGVVVKTYFDIVSVRVAIKVDIDVIAVDCRHRRRIHIAVEVFDVNSFKFVADFK